MTSLRTLSNESITIYEWRCETCGRTGIAARIQGDPASPGTRVYRAHQAQQPQGTEMRADHCIRPSLTWKVRP